MPRLENTHHPGPSVLTSRVFPASGKRRYPRPRFPRETSRGLPRSRFLWRTLFFRSHSVLNIRISCQRLETRRPRMGSRHSGLSASVRGGRRCLSLHSPSRRSKANNGHHNQHTQSEMRQPSRVSLILFQFSHPRERGLKTERRRTISGVPNYTHTHKTAHSHVTEWHSVASPAVCVALSVCVSTLLCGWLSRLVHLLTSLGINLIHSLYSTVGIYYDSSSHFLIDGHIPPPQILLLPTILGKEKSPCNTSHSPSYF